MASKNNGVIFLTKDRLDIYIPNIPDVLHYVFSENLVTDMEVVSKDELVNQIAVFLQQNNVSGVSFICLIHEGLLFGKEFKNVPIEQLAENKKNFIASVPFEYTLIKEVPLKEGSLVIATNRMLIESLILGVQKSSNTISYVSISYMVLEGIDTSGGFTREIGEVTLKKNEAVKQASFIAEEKSSYQAKNTEPLSFFKRPENRRAIILLVVFSVLVVILIIVYFISISSNQPTAPKETTNAGNFGQNTTPTPLPVPTITSPAETRIQIKTSDLERFSQLQTALSELNFQIIELDTSSISLVPNTTIIFDSSLSPSLQQNITQIIQTFDESTTTQVSSLDMYHAVINVR